MLVPTSYVSPTLLCNSHPLMLVPLSNVSHKNGTNWNDTQIVFLYLDGISAITKKLYILRIISLFLYISFTTQERV